MKTGGNINKYFQISQYLLDITVLCLYILHLITTFLYI